MTPGARVQAAIELIDMIAVAARENGAAADVIVDHWFRERRFAGSKDRRAVRELVYRAIRSFGSPPVSGRAAILGLGDLDALFDGATYSPGVITAGEARSTLSLLPEWLAALIPQDEHAALLERAPFDVRINSLKTSPEAILPLLKGAVPISGTAAGYRLPENIALSATPALRGLVEVQDAGSQLIVRNCAAKSGDIVVDLCAGAGGKTLALASDMLGQGQLVACDTDRGRLSRLPRRAELAGVTSLDIRLLNPNREMAELQDLEEKADIVLVDAPCSGTGTWRRNPELRWRLSPERLAQVVSLQEHVLKIGAQLVKSGGIMVYAVCSLLDKEGQEQISNFLTSNDGWKALSLPTDIGRPHGDGVRFSPGHDGTDGFFMARLQKL